jgi:flagellar basal-body rod protein FlgB
MIREVIFNSRTLDQAKGALDASALRQRVIASNLANADTPGYKAQEVAFEEMLTGEQEKLRMSRTQPGHLPNVKAPATPSPVVRPRGGDPGAGGVNDVSPEREMTELAQNTIHFQAVAQLVANRYRGIRDAIRPGA